MKIRTERFVILTSWKLTAISQATDQLWSETGEEPLVSPNQPGSESTVRKSIITLQQSGMLITFSPTMLNRKRVWLRLKPHPQGFTLNGKDVIAAGLMNTRLQHVLRINILLKCLVINDCSGSASRHWTFIFKWNMEKVRAERVNCKTLLQLCYGFKTLCLA